MIFFFGGSEPHRRALFIRGGGGLGGLGGLGGGGGGGGGVGGGGVDVLGLFAHVRSREAALHRGERGERALGKSQDFFLI